MLFEPSGLADRLESKTKSCSTAASYGPEISPFG